MSSYSYIYILRDEVDMLRLKYHNHAEYSKYVKARSASLHAGFTEALLESHTYSI